MTTARNLYELQQIDLEINQKQTVLDSVELELSSNEILLKAEKELKYTEEHLREISRLKHDNEWAINELQKSIEQLHNKLFSGKITNPKELLSLEQESGAFKKNLKQNEDILINLMTDEELTQGLIIAQKSQLETLKVERQLEQIKLSKEKGELEKQLADLNLRRDIITNGIEAIILNLYDGIKSRKGRAVVRVEQGRCQGCRINLSTSEWQKVKGGAIIQCSSCGLILYLG